MFGCVSGAQNTHNMSNDVQDMHRKEIQNDAQRFAMDGACQGADVVAGVAMVAAVEEATNSCHTLVPAVAAGMVSGHDEDMP